MDCAGGYVGFNRSIRSRERHDESFTPTAGSGVPAPLSQESAGLGAGHQIVLMHNVVGVKETIAAPMRGIYWAGGPSRSRATISRWSAKTGDGYTSGDTWPDDV